MIKVAFKYIQVVCVLLHHNAAFVQIIRAIVGGAYCVFLNVGKLCFDYVRAVSLFIKQGRRHCSKAVYGHLLPLIPHAAQGIQQAHIRYTAGAALTAGKTQRAALISCP